MDFAQSAVSRMSNRRDALANMTKEEVLCCDCMHSVMKLACASRACGVLWQVKAHLLAESRKRVLAGMESRRKSLGDIEEVEQPARPGSPEEPMTPNRKSVEGQIERAMKRKKQRAAQSPSPPPTSAIGDSGVPCTTTAVEAPGPTGDPRELVGAFDQLDLHQVDSVPRKHLANALETLTGARSMVAELEALQVSLPQPACCPPSHAHVTARLAYRGRW